MSFLPRQNRACGSGRCPSYGVGYGGLDTRLTRQQDSGFEAKAVTKSLQRNGWELSRARLGGAIYLSLGDVFSASIYQVKERLDKIDTKSIRQMCAATKKSTQNHDFQNK